MLVSAGFFNFRLALLYDTYIVLWVKVFCLNVKGRCAQYNIHINFNWKNFNYGTLVKLDFLGGKSHIRIF